MNSRILEIIGMAKTSLVNTNETRENPLNPRREYDLSDLLVSYRTTGGNTVPALVLKEKIDGKIVYTIFRGHRRVRALKESGIDKVLCLVIPESANVTESERLELLADDNGRTMKKSEAFRLISEFFKLGYSPARVTRLCANLLNTAFGAPAPEKIIEARKIAIENGKNVDDAEMDVIESKHRGNVQYIEKLSAMPASIQEEYCKSWDGLPCALTQKDVKELFETKKSLLADLSQAVKDDPIRLQAEKEHVDKAIEDKAKAITPEYKAEKSVNKCMKYADVERLMGIYEAPMAKITFKVVMNLMTLEKYAEEYKRIMG